jgi:hypothetical protein
MIQYSREVRDLSKGRGVLDPRLRGDDELVVG